MLDAIIITSVLGGILLLWVGLCLLMDRQHYHCWHTIPGEEGLRDEQHGRFLRTTRVIECCGCPESVPGEVVAERQQVIL